MKNTDSKNSARIAHPPPSVSPLKRHFYVYLSPTLIPIQEENGANFHFYALLFVTSTTNRYFNLRKTSDDNRSISGSAYVSSCGASQTFH
jgi:hypothetical protein